MLCLDTHTGKVRTPTYPEYTRSSPSGYTKFSPRALLFFLHTAYRPDFPFERSKQPLPALDIIGHADQVKLVAQALVELNEDARGVNDDVSPMNVGFERGWATRSGLGGSWGMPPSAEERGEVAARRRKAAATRAKTVLSRLTLWKEKGLNPGDVRDGKVTDAGLFGGGTYGDVD